MLWKAGILRTSRDGWEAHAHPVFLLYHPVDDRCTNARTEGPGPPPAQVEQTSHGIRATAGSEVLEVTVCSDSVIHVVATPEPSAPATPRPWMLDAQRSCPGAPFTFAQGLKAASLKTAQLEVVVDVERGNLSFRTISGESLLNEGNSIPRTYEPVELNGDHTYRVTDRFSPSITEAVYGLGQRQNGMFNYRGATMELGQNNTDVAIPLLISNKGYGPMWNTAALTLAARLICRIDRTPQIPSRSGRRRPWNRRGCDQHG